MANNRKNLELKLNELFVRNTPGLPRVFKKTLRAWMPIIALIAGAISIATAYSMWHWGHDTDKYIQGVCNAYSVSGCGNPVAVRLSIWLWMAIAFAAVQGILYLLAYPGLRDRKKDGWDYLYYGLLLNVVFAIISLFTYYNKISHFLGGLIVSAIGFYFIFQVRSQYTAGHRRPVVAAKTPQAKSSYTTERRSEVGLTNRFEQTGKKQ